ncbi:MAG: caspase family protein [Deltaproteobacteria bacterium]|nr:caspase family protein [Deltaproteobacteria bacterium]
MKRPCILCFFFLSLLTGCADPIIRTHTAPAVDAGYRLEKEMTVSSKNGWQGSGISLQAGQKVIIRANGLWNKGFASDCGPDGYIGAAGEMRYSSEYGAMSLLGKIGNGKEFLVGSYLLLEAPAAGELSFRPNCADIGFWDNSGGLSASIYLPGFAQTPAKALAQKSAQNESPQGTSGPAGKEASQRGGASWAVVIGISQYRHAADNGLPNLVFADDDAKAFARTLQHHGWSESHIKLLLNETATQRNIMIALESWLTKAGPNDRIVLFWAGHGYPDPEDPEKVYFACYDTDLSTPATGYRMDYVRRALEEKKAKNVVLLADTCHAGKLISRGDGSRGISIMPDLNKLAREKKIPKGWVFMVGADTDRQAIEHTSWANGAFTHSLLKGLNGEADGFQSAGAKDGVVTMGELKAYMTASMPEETQKVLGVAKHPVITTTTGDPDIWNITLQEVQ